jgi:hypothetical protein
MRKIGPVRGRFAPERDPLNPATRSVEKYAKLQGQTIRNTILRLRDRESKDR